MNRGATWHHIAKQQFREQHAYHRGDCSSNSAASIRPWLDSPNMTPAGGVCAYAKKATEQMNPEGSGMQFVEHTAAPTPQMGYCVKEYAKFEDHGSPVAPKGADQRTGLCVPDPDSSKVIVQAVFRTRATGERDPQVPYHAEQFLQA